MANHPNPYAMGGNAPDGHASGGGGIGAGALFAMVAAKQRAQKAKKPVIVSLLDSMEFNFVQQLEQNVVVYTLHSALIILSVVAYVAETSPEFAGVEPALWVWAELIFTVVFTIEVVLRYFGHLQNDSAFWADPLIWVDFLSIAPFVVVFFMCEAQPWDTESCDARDLWYINILQAFKMLRVFKVSRHFAGTKILVSTFQQSMRALRAPFVFLFVSVTIFAALMYFLESGQWNDEAGAYLMEDGQPPTFTSILDAAYFVVVTMTTVGYGDQSPSTSLGKGLAIAMMLFGVLFTAMPLTIVGNEFYDAIEKEGGFQYLLDAESLDDKSEAKVITFERVSHEFVLVGAAVTRLNRYVDRVTHDPTNLTATDYENEKHVLSLMREWVKRHVKFMYTLRVLTTPNYHDKAKYLAWKNRVKRLGFNRSYSNKRISPTAASRKEQEGSQRRIFDISSQSSARSAVDHASTLQHNAPSLRRRLYLFLDEPDSSRAASLWATFIFALIVVSIVALMVENQVDANRGAAPDAERLMSFVVIIAVVNCIFTAELVLRLLVTDDLKTFCSSIFNIFDFIAILPFYLNIMFGVDSVLLRLVRILRIFKLSSRIEGTRTVVDALRASFRSLLIPVYMLIVITLVFGAAFWLAEQGSESVGADGETVRTFDDGSVSEVTGIVRAGWVIIVTMTTVGYGDITPSTAAGRMVCVIAMLFGVLYMAMPIAIVGNNFWKAYEKHMKGKDASKPDNKGQEVVQLPPTQQVTFELAVDSGRKLARAVAMMDRRVRKLRKTFKDPEVAGPSATIIAARMLDAMTDGASPASLAGTASARLKGVQSPLVMAGDPAADVGAALMARRSSSASDGGAAAAAVAAAHAGAGVGAGASDGGESKSNVRSPLVRVKLDSLPDGGAGSRRNLPALPASAVMKGVAAGLSPAASPMAGSTDSLDARLLQHTASFARGSVVPREMSYGAANTTTGVGLVRVVTATYLDHLLSLSEVLSYLHEALELQDLKNKRVGHISLQTARKAEEMFQKVISRQKRRTQLRKMESHQRFLQRQAALGTRHQPNHTPPMGL